MGKLLRFLNYNKRDINTLCGDIYDHNDILIIFVLLVNPC